MSPPPDEPAAPFRAGFCAIVGRPNVGKSTLLNQVLGEKLAVVTPKPQTTRDRILGVHNVPGGQIVYVDTPGVHVGKSALNKYMVDQAVQAASEADVVLVIVEAPQLPAAKIEQLGWDLGDGVRRVFDAVKAVNKPRVLAVNKVDRLTEKEALLPFLAKIAEALTFDAVVPISARTGNGVAALEAEVLARLPEGPALYPEDVLTDRAERFLVAELVREQVFLQLKEELPYSIAVEIEAWEERPAKGDVMIHAAIHVERDGQKGIVVGHGGAQLKEIGTRARHEISKLLGRKAHLKLFVKVDPQWTEKAAALRRLGYA